VCVCLGSVCEKEARERRRRERERERECVFVRHVFLLDMCRDLRQVCPLSLICRLYKCLPPQERHHCISNSSRAGRPPLILC
jgi:hypothetical protein